MPGLAQAPVVVLAEEQVVAVRVEEGAVAAVAVAVAVVVVVAAEASDSIHGPTQPLIWMR